MLALKDTAIPAPASARAPFSIWRPRASPALSRVWDREGKRKGFSRGSLGNTAAT